MKFKDYWLSDYYRNTDGDTYKPYKYFFMGKKLRMIYWLRRCQCSRGLLQIINRLIYRHYSYWNNNEIPYKTQIGKGLYLGHSGGRYINKEAKIGDNCNINHNVTIGKENRGGRLGCPTIGSKVWIGCNSVIVGKVFIGDNVMIAPNSFVNFDVPSNSLVISGKIIKKDNPTEKYINNIV
ncbi:serine acetyltransferase [bacterium]|nr:serine acetyltransferase [bacterium]